MPRRSLFRHAYQPTPLPHAADDTLVYADGERQE